MLDPQHQTRMIEQRPILCLWGFMGTGKSTVGALVAAAHGATFVDLDQAIEKATGKTIAAIFAEDGEEAFREHEHQLLLSHIDLAAHGNTPRVLALGGGALLRATSRARALETCFVVTLTASVANILERTEGSLHRPLLAARGEQTVVRLLNARAPHYAEAHAKVATDDLSARAVAEHLSKRWRPQL